ncbi:hypothetical protein CYLTODRAFT_487012 [Cylindrobasidium torrendii FP15055 ss-10]|uniref:Protein PBN1 n=1 Tax=Cylindrobasidium torrendii FP15055 ss-10 TaxID=1314674 RepID=A0A0D7BNJ6_9AGAR|nr:hypothetical protein CYLTODRAFT_487012 [Cylindrobasidium torrendii FP15055 ss-10]
MADFTSSLHLNGFHPTLDVRILYEEPTDCTSIIFLDLPPEVLVDRFELANYAAEYSFHLLGPSNVELPVVALANETSHLMLEITPEDSLYRQVTIPLHLRYPEVGTDDYVAVTFPAPHGYLACPLPEEENVTDKSVPIEFAHILTSSRLTSLGTPQEAFTLKIPAGNSLHTPRVEAGTSILILLCCVYMAYKSFATVNRLSNSR